MEIFLAQGGLLRTHEAIQAGIHPRTLYRLCQSGKIEKIGRGLYGIPGLPEIEEPDLVTVAKKVQKGVICLISALYFHQLTNQIPHYIHVALPQKTKGSRLMYPPTQFYWFTDKIWGAGIEEHQIGKIPVKIYCKEKTIVDCFKHRNKVGVEVAIEALRNYWHGEKVDLGKIQEFAKLSRMEKVMKPYLETIINEQS